MIAEWDVPFELRTPSGTLKLNYTDPVTGYRWQLIPAKCQVTLPVRSTEDDIPQGDGKIPHRRWRSGYGVHLALEPYQSYDDVSKVGDPACGEVLVSMVDELGLHTNEMIRTGLLSGLPNARLVWTPTGHANRMFDRLQLQSDPVLSVLEGELGGSQIEFDLDSPFPYYISESETQTVLGGTGGSTVTNGGNADYYAVLQIDGDASYVEVINHSVTDLAGNPLKIVYFASLPGASAINAPDYVEIVLFNGTAFLNGSGARRLAGIDFRYTTFWPLVPGENLIEIVGATGLLLSNDAWS